MSQLLAVALFLAHVLVPAAEEASASRLSAVDAYLSRYQQSVDTPGIAVAVIGDDQVVHQRMLGTDGHGDALTPHTPFLLGSVSKPLTAVAVMQLVGAGDVSLDAPVVSALPWFRLADQDVSDRITTRQLLTHTSGISGADGLRLGDRFDNRPDGLARSVRALAGVQPVGEPGGEHRYSDANYMVLGALVEQVTGTSFGDYLHDHVLGPLGMHDAIVDAEAAADRLPPGHRVVFGQPRTFDSPYDTSGLPYGYVGASLEDLSQFAIAELNGGAFAGRRILSADLVAQTQTAQVTTSNGGYGLGWRTGRLDGHTTVWHSGATPGFFTTILLVPSEHLAVVTMQNVYGPARDAQLNEAAFNVVRLLHGTATRSPGVDPLVAYAPWALSGLALALAALLVWSLLRARRRGASRRLAVSWAAGALPTAAAVGWLLPWAQGVDLSRIGLWTPGVAVGIVTVLICCGVAVVTTTGLAMSHREAATQPPQPPRRPSGMSRFLFRLPLWLYRAHLGALLGRRFVLINHIGRVSGRSRQVVVEVVEHDAATRDVVVASGFGPKADWYRNLLANPEVSITVGAHSYDVRAVPLHEAEAGEAMVRYARRHRVAARGLARFMGFEADGTESGYRDVGRRIPMLRLETARGGRR